MQPDWQVTVLEIDGQWAKVVTKSGIEGYILAKNVTAPAPSSMITGTPSASNPTGFSPLTGSVNLRTEPDATSAKQRVLLGGWEVKVLSIINGWAEVVTKGGLKGYVKAKYIKN